MLRLGLISDMHGDAKNTRLLLHRLVKEGVDAIAMVGDFGDDSAEINAVLKAARAKVPIIAFPGSHEPLKVFNALIRKHKKVIDGMKKRKITIKGYDLVTMPGSGIHAHSTGFMLVDTGRIPREYLKRFRLFFPSQLKKIVRDPAKTVVLAHDPPHCSAKESIDVANSGRATREFVVKPKYFKILSKRFHQKLKRNPLAFIIDKGSIIQQPDAAIFKRLRYPVSIKLRHVGTSSLGKALRKNKIQFFACGHIHEAGQKAISSKGKPVKEGIWNNSVWYNVGPAKEGKCGLLIVENGQGMYKNIRA